MRSCRRQHATRLGAFAGNNAAADLLGVPTSPYHQEAYVTCLDLGAAGAVLTRGWDRKVALVRANAKKVKREINTVSIPRRAPRACGPRRCGTESVPRLHDELLDALLGTDAGLRTPRGAHHETPTARFAWRPAPFGDGQEGVQ